MKVVDFFTVTLDDTELRYVLVKGIPYFLYVDIKDFIGVSYESISYLKNKLGSDGCIKTCIPTNSVGVNVTVMSPEWLFKLINWLKKYNEKHAHILKDFYQNTYGVICEITNPPVKICVICGKVIPPERTRNNAKCCSSECKRIYSREYQKVYQHNLWFDKKKISYTEKTCPICGNKFTTTNNNQRYCSTKCSNKATWLRIKERKQMLKTGFYNPKAVYSIGDLAEQIEWDDEHIDAYLRRLHAWEWGLVKDDLKTWIN